MPSDRPALFGSMGQHGAGSTATIKDLIDRQHEVASVESSPERTDRAFDLDLPGPTQLESVKRRHGPPPAA